MDTVNEQIAAAPLPTRKTLRRRNNLVVQATRFAAINARIIRMVIRGH